MRMPTLKLTSGELTLYLWLKRVTPDSYSGEEWDDSDFRVYRNDELMLNWKSKWYETDPAGLLNWLDGYFAMAEELKDFSLVDDPAFEFSVDWERAMAILNLYLTFDSTYPNHYVIYLDDQKLKNLHCYLRLFTNQLRKDSPEAQALYDQGIFQED